MAAARRAGARSTAGASSPRAFVLAVFGWGIGFFGPPVFLSTLQATTRLAAGPSSRPPSPSISWSAPSSARACRRSIAASAPPAVTKAGALALVVGIFGWAVATAALAAVGRALLSGAGWGAMSASAVNAHRLALVRARAPRGAGHGLQRRQRRRHHLLAAVGGGHRRAGLSGCGRLRRARHRRHHVGARRPASSPARPQAMGVAPDGDAPGAPPAAITSPAARPLPGRLLWRDRRFLTLAAGMALGLFAQIGLVAHLFSLLVPALGAQQAGLAMGLVTVMAVSGRTLIGWLMPAGGRPAPRRLRRLRAAARGLHRLPARAGREHAAAAARRGPVRRRASATPPRCRRSSPRSSSSGRRWLRVVALIVGISQAALRLRARLLRPHPRVRPCSRGAAPGAAPYLFAAAALAQTLAIGAFLAGRVRG